MGLKPGEKIERLGQIRVTNVRRESLKRMIDEPTYGIREAKREGFPKMRGSEFALMFVQHMGGDLWQVVTRIEFEYLEE